MTELPEAIGEEPAVDVSTVYVSSAEINVETTDSLLSTNGGLIGHVTTVDDESAAKLHATIDQASRSSQDSS